MSFLIIAWLLLFRHANDLTIQQQNQPFVVTIDSVFFLPLNIPSDSLKKKSLSANFQPATPTYKLKGGNWLSFRINNPSPSQQSVIVEIESTVYFDLIELFVGENGGLKSLGITGDPIHHSLRPIKDHGLLFPIVLPPSSVNHYYLFATSPLEYQLPLAIQSMESFVSKRNANNMFYTFYYGFITFVLAFTIFLAVIFYKERIYLFYSLYLLSLLFLFLHLNGFGYEFLWPNWPEFDKRIPYIAASTSMIFLLRFTRHFLRADHLKPIEIRVFDFYFYTYCLSLVLAQFIFSDPLIKKIYLFVFISFVNLSFFVIAWIIAFRVYRTGYRPALFYSIAFFFFFVSVSLYSARSMFPINGWFSQHIIQLGNIIEVMVLTLGLAYWFKANQDEKQELLENVSKQRKEMADEKDRIMRDLHDSLGGQLSSISIGLNRLNNNHYHDIVHSIQSMADKALSELRNSLWVMSHDSVTMAELEQRVNSLFWQYRKLETPIDLQINVEPSLLDYQLPSNKAGHLYRIMQEATHNSVKHSKATHFKIDINKANDQLKVVMLDNGIGFNIPEHIDGEHYGIKNMKTRAEQMESRLEMTSTTIGTQLVISISLNS